jgi:hypothetical protein
MGALCQQIFFPFLPSVALPAQATLQMQVQQQQQQALQQAFQQNQAAVQQQYLLQVSQIGNTFGY